MDPSELGVNGIMAVVAGIEFPKAMSINLMDVQRNILIKYSSS